MNEKEKYQRFCVECHVTTYEWFHCGKRTRRLNMQVSIKDRIKMEVKK